MSLIEKVKNINRRPNWNEYFMTVAYVLANRSSCDRLHVGCVIVNDNRIITTGYNGHIRGTPHISVIVDEHEQMTIHAETNAIADAANRGVSLKGSTAYVTHYPCINCAKNLISAGIKEIVYGEDYKNNVICGTLYLMSGVRINKFVDPYYHMEELPNTEHFQDIHENIHDNTHDNIKEQDTTKYEPY
jgi:dCMP deaminase